MLIHQLSAVHRESMLQYFLSASSPEPEPNYQCNKIRNQQTELMYIVLLTLLSSFPIERTNFLFKSHCCWLLTYPSCQQCWRYMQWMQNATWLHSATATVTREMIGCNYKILLTGINKLHTATYGACTVHIITHTYICMLLAEGSIDIF